jgi:hypothetical protein
MGAAAGSMKGRKTRPSKRGRRRVDRGSKQGHFRVVWGSFPGHFRVGLGSLYSHHQAPKSLPGQHLQSRTPRIHFLRTGAHQNTTTAAQLQLPPSLDTSPLTVILPDSFAGPHTRKRASASSRPPGT